MSDECGWCDHPEEGHGVRYAAGRGDHTWEPAKGPKFIPYTRRNDRPCFCATTGNGAQHTCGTPSDRLPPRTPEPAATENRAPEQAPDATAALSFTEFGQRVEPKPGVIRRILNARKANT